MYCKNCGVLNDEDALYCKKCGFDLDGDNLDKDSNDNKGKAKSKTKKKTKTKVKKKIKKKKVKSSQDKKGMSFGQKLFMILLVFIIMVLLGILVAVGYYYWDSQSIIVPDVVNMSYEEAELSLAQADLKIEKHAQITNDITLDNIIVKQNKKAGSKVAKNATIKVYVGNYQGYLLDDFVGMKIDKVKKILDKDNINYRITYQASDKEEGIVLGQTPSKDTEISYDYVVSLVVSEKIDSAINSDDKMDIDEDSNDEEVLETGE